MDSNAIGSRPSDTTGLELVVRCEVCHAEVTVETGLLMWEPRGKYGHSTLTLRCKECDRKLMEETAEGGHAYTLRWLVAHLAHAAGITAKEVVEEMRRIPKAKTQ
jgi:hypothetical protein